MEINDLLRMSKTDPLDSILVLCKLLNVDKSYIFTYGNRKLSTDIVDNFLQLMEKRHKGYPLHYILGQRDFMGLDFYLEEGVLIPRSDTELLVEYIIDYIGKNHGQERINLLDIGIGSGAISLSIANYCKNTQVVGIDISRTAIRVANINKERFNLTNVDFYQGDLFQGLEALNMEDSFHIIVSNPPYISKEVIESLDPGVKDFEPRLALDGGEDGLDFYRRITSQSKDFLRSGGLLIYEIGYDQGDLVRHIMVKEGFKNLSILKDLQGHDRVIMGFIE